jgi:DNA polymerase-1
MPDGFPSLEGAKGICIDIETYDPDLTTLGAGVRRDGYILGVAVATDDFQFQEYYPVAHQSGQNFNKNAVFSWLREELGRHEQRKYFFNGIYDLDYLAQEGVDIPSRIYCDPMLAEPLIDENLFQYGLDVQCQKYLGKRKAVDLLEKEGQRIGLRKNANVYNHLREMDVAVVGQYAIEDVVDTIRVFHKQWPILVQQGLTDVYMLEQALIPLLLKMKRTGVRLDMDKLPQAISAAETELMHAQSRLDSIAGMSVNSNAAASIAAAFDGLGLSYPRTAKTKAPSFRKKWLENQNIPITQAILEVRERDKLLNTFLKSALYKHEVNGRIHCQFNQMKSDHGGTGTGRLSCSLPNLQQIPNRTALGKELRKLFIPEAGCIWVKLDYAQIEVRVLANYALGPGADQFRETYIKYPDTDYHSWTAEMTGKSRDQAKTVNFAKIYGQGVKSTAAQLGMTLEEAQVFNDEFFGALPFIKETMRKAASVAEMRGYVKTIMGRRRRYPFWGAADRRLFDVVKPSRDQKEVRESIRKVVNNPHHYFPINDIPLDLKIGIQRYKTYTALNSVIQGGAAELMKKAMVNAWEAGLFDVLIPHLTVHDELDVSMPNTKEGREAVEALRQEMVNAIDFSVPILADPEFGPSWGEVGSIAA